MRFLAREDYVTGESGMKPSVFIPMPGLLPSGRQQAPGLCSDPGFIRNDARKDVWPN